MRKQSAQASAARRGAGALESEVVAAVWAAPGPVSGTQVHAAVGPELSYKTVLTVLTRLCEKGVVERHRDGRAYRYTPVRARADEAAAQMSTALRRAGDRSAALHGFLAALDDADAAVLRTALETGRD